MASSPGSSLETHRVAVELGNPPCLRTGPTIFLANLEGIFFGEPEKTREIMDKLSGFDGYGTRLVPILGLLFRSDRNVLLLRKAPDPDLLRYYTDDLGLTLPSIEEIRFSPGNATGNYIISDATLKLAREHPAKVIDGYVTDTSLEELAGSLGKRPGNSFRACRDANDKILLNRFLLRESLPAFDGGETTDAAALRGTLQELKAAGYAKAVIRSPLGASGFGMHVADLDGTDALPAPETLVAEGRLLVHGWLEVGRQNITTLVSPSVQFACLEDGRISLFDMTEQLLSHKSVHEGNISPPTNLGGNGAVRRELLDQAARAASWVASTGYRGTGSVDFLVVEQGDDVTVYTCEVNARVTGATYPSLLAHHLRPRGSWLMRNVSFEPCTDVRGLLGILSDHRMLYAAGDSEGIIPVNAISEPGGRVVKTQLLFLAGEPERCLELIESFPGLLPARCRFAHD